MLHWLVSRPLKRAFRFLPGKIASLAAAGLSAQLGTLPLTVYYFNLISISVLANLLVLPVGDDPIGFLLIR